MANNVTYKVYVDKIGGRQVEDFVGQPGDLFYDPGAGQIRLSDGLTPGGVNTTVSSELSDDLARAIAQSAFNKANTTAADGFVTIHVASQNSITASSNVDTLRLVAGSGVSIVLDNGNNIITLSANTIDVYPRTHANAAFDLANLRAQNAFSAIGVQGIGTLSAASNSDSVIFSPGAGISMSGSDNTVTIRSSINSFSTLTVTGQNNVVATSNNDTLTLVSGTGIEITTNTSTDNVVITAANTVDQFARDRSNGTYTLANTKEVLLISSGIPVTSSNVSGAQSIVVVTIPGGAMGPNGWIECFATWTMGGSSNNKQITIRALGPVSQIINGITVTNHLAYYQGGIILNRANTQKQISAPSLQTYYGASSSANVNDAHTINTDSDWGLYFAVNKTTANDRVTLEQYRVHIQYRD